MREMWEDCRHALRYFVAGCVITGVSLAVQLTSAYPTEAIDSAEAARYLSSFVALWDAHRQPVTMTAGGVALNRASLRACRLIWLAAFSAVCRDPPGVSASGSSSSQA